MRADLSALQKAAGMTGPILSNRLADLAERAGEAARASTALARRSTDAKLEAGALLIEARAESRRGQWKPVLARAGIDERTARRWMQAARSGLSAEDIDARGGVRAVLRTLADERREGEKADRVTVIEPGADARSERLARAMTAFLEARLVTAKATADARLAVRREDFAAAVRLLRARRQLLRDAGIRRVRRFRVREILAPERAAAAAARLEMLREEADGSRAVTAATLDLVALCGGGEPLPPLPGGSAGTGGGESRTHT